jgi:putative Mn2+ efflux pump MntP
MFSLEIVLLGLALAIDAAVVTFAIGLMHYDMRPFEKLKRGVLEKLGVGFFHFVMVWPGPEAGFVFSFYRFRFVFQFVVALIFFGLALKFVQESLNIEEKKHEWGLIPVLILAFSTSIDAMASGVGLGTLPRAYFAAIEVGLITFSVCGGFYFISQFFRQIPDRWLLRFAAVIFLFLGVQIFWGLKHVFLKG